MANKTHPWHVVKIHYNGKYSHYEIWKDNVPAIVPAKKFKIGKLMAYTICRLLNYGEFK